MEKSIEEIREYFKDAKVVECVAFGAVTDITLGEEINVWSGGVWYGGNCKLWDEDNGYAKIIEYKTPEKLYTLKEEVNDMMALEYTDITKTEKEWLPIHISMLDEVKEVEVYDTELTSSGLCGSNTRDCNFSFTVSTKKTSGLYKHLEKATKEFFKNK